MVNLSEIFCWWVGGIIVYLFAWGIMVIEKIVIEEIRKTLQ
jgi:hypothetical protein